MAYKRLRTVLIEKDNILCQIKEATNDKERQKLKAELVITEHRYQNALEHMFVENEDWENFMKVYTGRLKKCKCASPAAGECCKVAKCNCPTPDAVAKMPVVN